MAFYMIFLILFLFRVNRCGVDSKIQLAPCGLHLSLFFPENGSHTLEREKIFTNIHLKILQPSVRQLWDRMDRTDRKDGRRRSIVVRTLVSAGELSLSCARLLAG